MTKEDREDAINCFKNKLENEVFGAKYNKLALEALEQESCDDCISRQSVLDKIQRLIDAEQNNIDENGDYMNYARERVNAYEAIQFFVENDCLCPSVTPQFSSGLDKELEKDFGESDCVSRDSAIKALDYDIKCFEFKPGVSKHMDDIAKLLNTIYETQVNNIKTLPTVPQEPILEKINKMKSEIADSLEFWDYSPNNNPLVRDMLETITNFLGDVREAESEDEE